MCGKWRMSDAKIMQCFFLALEIMKLITCYISISNSKARLWKILLIHRFILVYRILQHFPFSPAVSFGDFNIHGMIFCTLKSLISWAWTVNQAIIDQRTEVTKTLPNVTAPKRGLLSFTSTKMEGRKVLILMPLAMCWIPLTLQPRHQNITYSHYTETASQDVPFSRFRILNFMLFVHAMQAHPFHSVKSFLLVFLRFI